MFTWTRHLAVATLVGVGLFGAAGPASAQFRYYHGGGYGARPYYRNYNYNYYNPGYNYGVNGGYYPGYGGNGYGGDPYGGYLNGSANVINAQGQYLINSQQSYLIKEQVRSSQMDNRRKAYDEYLYEKANTPTLNDVRVKQQQEELRRAMTNPPETEIWAAKSLNDLLANLQQMQARGVQGPNVPLSTATLKQINLTVKDIGNVGLLKDAGKPKWPFALRSLSPKDEATELREQIDAALIKGKKQAIEGQVDADLLVELQHNVDKLRGMLKDVVANTSFSDYTAAKRYVNELDAAVKILKDPNVAKYVDGSYSAQGRNVEELVNYMTSKGLRFAPAINGEEGAYSALFQSMLQYNIGSTSMMTSTSPGDNPLVPTPK